MADFEAHLLRNARTVLTKNSRAFYWCLPIGLPWSINQSVSRGNSYKLSWSPSNRLKKMRNNKFAPWRWSFFIGDFKPYSFFSLACNHGKNVCRSVRVAWSDWTFHNFRFQDYSVDEFYVIQKRWWKIGDSLKYKMFVHVRSVLNSIIN